MSSVVSLYRPPPTPAHQRFNRDVQKSANDALYDVSCSATSMLGVWMTHMRWNLLHLKGVFVPSRLSSSASVRNLHLVGLVTCQNAQDADAADIRTQS